jgi:3D (Asp-Asp-Asp) domain-containing protein
MRFYWKTPIVISLVLLSFMVGMILVDKINDRQLSKETINENIISQKEMLILEKDKVIQQQQDKIKLYQEKLDEFESVPVPSAKPQLFKVTAYDLSVQSCGKRSSHPEYGITSRGDDLRGLDWRTARAIAVDPKVIALGSKVYVTFVDKEYSKYNGVFTCVDTGSAIKGNKIDFFMGDFNSTKPSKITMDFGVTYAKITVLERE